MVPPPPASSFLLWWSTRFRSGGSGHRRSLRFQVIARARAAMAIWISLWPTSRLVFRMFLSRGVSHIDLFTLCEEANWAKASCILAARSMSHLLQLLWLGRDWLPGN